jgi:two-component system, NtrC family, sensor histidine kinase KinB
MPEPESLIADVPVDALMRITQAVETAGTLDELLMLALRELTQLFDAPRGGVVLIDDADGDGQVVSEYPPQVNPPVSVQLDELPLLRRALHQRQPIQLHDIDFEGKHGRTWDLLRARDFRSVLLMPLIAQDRAIGLLALGSTDETRRFSTDEVALARMLSSQLAAAIATFRVHDEAQRRNHELHTLNEIASTITSTLDTREVYRLVVARLNTYFNVEAGSLLLIEKTTGDLLFVMTIEGGEAKLAGVSVPMGQGVVGAVAQNRKWEIVHDAERDPRFYRKVSEARILALLPARSYVCPWSRRAG